MNHLAVNTDKAKDVANRIRQHGVAIRDEYKDVEKKLKELENAWYGANANQVIDEFRKAIKNTPENLYEEFAKVSDILRCNVGDGYSVTEIKNKRLADAFK